MVVYYAVYYGGRYEQFVPVVRPIVGRLRVNGRTAAKLYDRHRRRPAPAAHLDMCSAYPSSMYRDFQQEKKDETK